MNEGGSNIFFTSPRGGSDIFFRHLRGGSSIFFNILGISPIHSFSFYCYAPYQFHSLIYLSTYDFQNIHTYLMRNPLLNVRKAPKQFTKINSQFFFLLLCPLLILILVAPNSLDYNDSNLLSGCNFREKKNGKKKHEKKTQIK